MIRHWGCVLGPVVVAAMLLSPAGVAAAETPTIAAHPIAGLRDGRTIAASGTGWDPNPPAAPNVTVAVCKAQVVGSPLNAADLCSNTGIAAPTVQSDGTITATLPVPRVSTSGQNTTIDCTTGPGACVVFAIQIVGFAGPRPIPTVISAATAPVSFRAQSLADCRGDRWQTFTNAKGGAFRSRGDCVAFVVLSKLFAVLGRPHGIGAGGSFARA